MDLYNSCPSCKKGVTNPIGFVNSEGITIISGQVDSIKNTTEDTLFLITSCSRCGYTQHKAHDHTFQKYEQDKRRSLLDQY